MSQISTKRIFLFLVKFTSQIMRLRYKKGQYRQPKDTEGSEQRKYILN